MANLWLDLKGPILADTVYVDGVLAAKDVTIALPPVNLVTADFKAMGTYTAPLLGQIEAMEASITKIGIDLGLRSLVKLTSKTIEIRWAQDVKLSDGSTKTEGCKAFLRCVSKGIPGLNGRARGDQYVTVYIETPRNLNREQKEALRKFSDTLGESNYEQRKSFFGKFKL